MARVAPAEQGEWADADYYGVRSGPGWITIRAIANRASSPRTRRFDVGGQTVLVWQPGATNSPWFDAWYPTEQEPKPLGLVLQHSTTQSFSFWTADPRTGTSVRRSTPAQTLDNAWQIVGTGDFNIDGQSDVLLRHGDGRKAVWLMNDGGLVDSVSMGWTDPEWLIRSVADMDRDGRVDLLWQHLDGRVAVWLMDGLTPRSGLLLTPDRVERRWFLVTSGDFNGDGWVDLIWHHIDGRVAVWFMRGTQMISGEVFATVNMATWQIKGAGDMDGDGWPDLLWQHTGSDLLGSQGHLMGVWYMKGLVMTQGLPFVLDVPVSFRLAAPK